MDNPVNGNANNSNRLRQGFSRFGYWTKKVLPLIGIIMPLAYIGAGIYVVLSERMKDVLQPINRYLLCGLLIAYGIFRAYRLITAQKDNDNDEDQ